MKNRRAVGLLNPVGDTKAITRGEKGRHLWLESRSVKYIYIHIYIDLYIYPVAPVAYQVIFEPGIGQFREFEPRRVHTRINLLGLFLVHELTCGKRESVS